MTRIAVELLTDEGNDVVVRLPSRKFPGVVVQGDSLHELVATAKEAIVALEDGDTAVGVTLVRAIAERLSATKERYEAALTRNSIPAALDDPNAWAGGQCSWRRRCTQTVMSRFTSGSDQGEDAPRRSDGARP